jgi:hypothetical protein
LSQEDPDLPIQRVSRPEDRERLLAEALAHAEALEEQYRVVPADPPHAARWKGALAVVTFGIALLTAVFPPAWLAGPPAAIPTPGDRDRGLRTAVFLQAQQVEAFRVREGRLPLTLAELPARLPGLTLVRSNNRVYQIRGRRADGTLVIYDSARPSPAFEASAVWPRTERP